VAENCTSTLHNLYTPRGAQIRDGLAWSEAIQDALERFRGRADVLFCCHNWPTWGAEEIEGFLGRQRDAYRFLHDQTMRLANHGLTATEIAEQLELPEALRTDLSLRDYYGTVNHNAKAVYQRYLGWFDGNPARLHPLPPEAAARRYLDYMGGAEAVVARARADFDDGGYRWVAQVLDHVIFAEPDHEEARLLLADTLEQLGYQAESAPWRDFYLTGAQELRHGTLRGLGGTGATTGEDVVAAMTVEMLLRYLGVRLDGPAVADLALTLDLTVTDRSERWRVGLAHGALHHTRLDTGPPSGTTRRPPAPVALTLDHAALAALVRSDAELDDLVAEGRATLEGDATVLQTVLANLDEFEFWFDIVTP
jgi:alkyl sulfatase BDS1-like metallo-beta-lactamase superfamily hydrolase